LIIKKKVTNTPHLTEHDFSYYRIRVPVKLRNILYLMIS